MKVRNATIIGLVVGFLFGNMFPAQLSFLGFLTLGLSVLGIIFNKRIMKGWFFGLVLGVLSGYALQTYFYEYFKFDVYDFLRSLKFGF